MMETDAYIEWIVCARSDVPLVELCDEDGRVRRYTRAEFHEAYGEGYGDGELEYVLSCLPTMQCDCCQWGDA